MIGGGIIVFGIDEDSGYKVVGVYDAQDLQKKVVEQSLQMEPVVRPLFTVARVEIAMKHLKEESMMNFVLLIELQCLM
jgi:hypothetical protein